VRATGTATDPGIQWAGNNTQDTNTTGGANDVNAAATDADQVRVMVAHLKMNQ
jgi:hypothetical protein